LLAADTEMTGLAVVGLFTEDQMVAGENKAVGEAEGLAVSCPVNETRFGLLDEVWLGATEG
jgi:hypothetical protein